MWWIWCILGAIFCALFLKERMAGRNLRSVFLKVMTSTCFFLMAWQGLFQCQTISFGLWFVAACFFGLMGDVWLGLKWTYPKQDTMFTFAGFVCFSVEHFFLLMGLVLYTGHPVALLFALILAMILSYVVVGMEKKMKLKYGYFKGISLIYGSLLFSVPIFSFLLCCFHHFQGMYVWTLLAGLFFMASDLILSGTYFGKGKDRPIHIISNHILYFMAQFILAYVIWIC